MYFLKNKSILITGGTGSFGSRFLKYLLNIKKNKPKRVIVFSRDELKQFELSKIFESKNYPSIRFFLGDIRDKQRLKMAFENVDYVIHAAALKQVPTAEYNPIEFIKTNVIGSQNIIEAALEGKVKKVIALSTDKASSPINLYGATKLCADKLFLSANKLAGKKKTSFSVVRYGNVFGSRGSVIPFFLNLVKQKKKLIVTDPNMTRFNIDLDEAVKLVVNVIKNSIGGEIFVPKISSYRIMDIVKAIQNKNDIKIIGIRPGEKLHEELISKSEGYNTFDIGNYYIIAGDQKSVNFYKKRKYKKIKPGKNYNSFDNTDFLNVQKLQKLIKNYKKI
ncbi:UDP-N-acetylglucosamine 4,6-dehydratase (inverting) [Candidatus Pelagibacter sp.]|nr:UDP-N-acetylglucosamine 4,6-dehydratase (inverting) [Candidatus Pelagibacter sp.]